MTAAEIRAEIDKLAPWVSLMCYDADYDRPTTKWLTNSFYTWFKNTRWEGDLSKWTRKNDCDNFARAFCTFAQDAHALSTGSAEGLAVGEFCYVANSARVKGPHAIVVAFTELGMIFIEPQTGEQITLTPEEKQTCFHVVF